MTEQIQDITLLEDWVSGLKQKLRDLRNDKALFDKAKGMDESIEKTKGEAIKIREEVRIANDAFKLLVEKKNTAMKAVTGGIMQKMNAILPAGKSVITIGEDGDCAIGWNGGKCLVPYAGLSGGEKVAFDTALVYALGGNILIGECAEMDAKRLSLALEQYAKTGLQVIVSSCHNPATVAEGWRVERL